ncbi:hypothetical protein TRFO_43677 [Tritrichomonas foetus]|uniref:Dynein regulatory complex protein 1 C-terminal domain-containing protein n=1 Tax=Tritrichomonas foetus TaxID=1144522 RepID=A0A1J4JG31_9EUKA|nr:hypothetical protein TRFO_43677 [Tritrichomonas foetus]|eukprot:OHS96405.1 hypothetical protein TRFO_43677 [Tritrichomonas foetus]
MASVLTKEEEDRAPIKQVASSAEEVQKAVDTARNGLSHIVQQHLAIEQERSHRFKEMRRRFEDQFSTIEAKVTKGMGKLENGWNSLLDQNLPLEFDKELRAQRQATDDVVALKLAFMKELEQEAMRRDHEYVNKIAEQNSQIDEYVHQMRQQEDSIRTKMAEELQKVKSSFEQEKTLQTTQIEKEVKQIASKRQEKEQVLMKEVLQTAKDQRDTLEQIRQVNAETYLKHRIEHEMKLQATQKEYEDCVAKYLFSNEQLDYNFRILQENDEEHEEKVKMQMKKLVRQRDCLRALRKRYDKEDKQFEKQNIDITKDYKRIAQSYRELQLRFRNVAYTDFNAFREVWNLNEKRLHELVLKILEADRVVNEQILGKKPKDTDPDYLKRWIIGTEEFEDLTKTPQAPPENSTDQIQTTRKESAFLSNKQLSEPLEHLWKLVSNEVGFLVDDRVKNLVGIQENGQFENNQDMIRVDVLLQELGITQTEDIEQLLSYFLKDTEFGELETPGFVRPHEVLEGLRKFVEAYHPNAQQNQTSYFAQITADATQNTSSEVARAILQLQSKMKKQLPAQRKFWEKKTEVVTEEMWRIWTAAFKAIQRYVAELEERAKLVEETDRLKQQNNEFQMLLANYVESENNDALIYAPAETVDFQAD